MSSQRLAGIGIILVSTIVTLLFCEGIFRVLNSYQGFRFFNLDFPDRKSGFYEYDSNLGWKNRQGYHRYHRKHHGTILVDINNQGWRDKEYAIVKPNDVYRIAVLGCSFTFGEGVDVQHSYPKILEEQINKVSNGKVEVLNFGVNGYGIDQMVINYGKFVRHYQPDLVLMQFFDFNAYRTLHSVMWRTQKPKFVLEDGRLVLTNHPVPQSRFKSFERWLLSKSIFYKFIIERWLKLEDLGNKRIKDNMTTNKDLHLLSESILKRLKKDVEQNQSRLVVFVKGTGDESWTKRVTQAAGIEVLNINEYEDVKTWQQAGDLFNPYPDHHWSAFGNQYVATSIFNFLKEKNIGNVFSRDAVVAR